MKKLLLTGCIVACTALAVRADGPVSVTELLQQYQTQSDPALITRQESLGHLTTYSRDEIEKYHFYRLSDVIASLRITTSELDERGLGVFHFATTRFDTPTSIRLYLNDHEMSSVATASASSLWSSLPLDAIDHIEIYQGGSAVRLGDDTGLTLIRLFTKDPAQNEGSILKAALSTTRDRTLSVLHAAETPSSSYTLFAAGMHRQDDGRNAPGGPIRSNGDTSVALANVMTGDTSVTAGYLALAQGPFIGYDTDYTPDGGTTRLSQMFLAARHPLDRDRSAWIKFSYSRFYENSYQTDTSGDLSNPELKNLGLPYPYLSSSYHQSYRADRIEVMASRELTVGNHAVYLAGQIKDSTLRPHDFSAVSGGTYYRSDTLYPTTRETVVSVMAEESYRLSATDRLIAGIKIDGDNRYSPYGTALGTTLRVGTINILSPLWRFKAFASATYLPPSMQEVSLAAPGERLKNEKVSGISGELAYQHGKLSLSFLAGWIVNSDPIYFHPLSHTMVNAPGNSERVILWTDGTYRASPDMILSWGYYMIPDPPKPVLSAAEGGYIRGTVPLMNGSLFAETIYRQGYKSIVADVGEGWCLNAGASYPLTRRLNLRIKGENLLGSAVKSPYEALGPTGFQSFSLTPTQRKAIGSIEWLF